MRIWTWCLCTTAVATLVSLASAAQAGPLTTINSEVDIIPATDSAESQQNSEPSLAVNPTNPNQIVAGAFTAIFSAPPVNVTTPFFQSTNGGTTWSDFGSLQTLDKSLAWKTDGSAPLAASLNGVSGGNNQIQTFTTTNFGMAGGSFNSNLNNFNPPAPLDQPWVRTGPSNHVYVGYNNVANTGSGFGGSGNGATASLNVSTNGGSTYTPHVIDTVGTSFQDSPAIREAINGNTVYAVFTRWNTIVSNSSAGFRAGSDIVVVKSTDGGATFSTGTRVNASLNSVTDPFTNCSSGCVLNTPLTLGAERVGSNNAIAVAPNNVNRVIAAYVDSPVLGQMQVVVSESTDGGATWGEKYRTPIATRSALPAVTILADGQVVLLYDNYAPQDGSNSVGTMSQHLVATSDDFATTTDIVLASEVNNNPTAQFSPYLGDFFDITSIGNNFYGIFSASNADNATLASYLLNAGLFQRDFSGTPGTGTFELTDGSGNIVPFSIDPIFFSGTSTPVPEPASLSLLVASLLGLAALRRRRVQPTEIR